MKASDLALYAVSACNAPADDLLEAQKGGATFLQLREKELDHREFLAKAKDVMEFAGVPFVINDDVEIALESGADGVHVGQSDASLAEAREMLGEKKIVGVSCTRIKEALAAEKGGADYLGVGAVFPTGTKPDAAEVPRNTLKAITASVRIPVVAIGGISLANVGELAGTGIAGTAVVSALFGKGDVRARTEEFAAKNSAMLHQASPVTKGAIIDLDGVVLDSMKVWDDIDIILLKRYHIFSQENLALLHSCSTIEDAADTLIRRGISLDPVRFHAEVEDLLKEAYLEKLPLMPGAENALKVLKASGTKTALLTASPESLVIPALKRLGVSGLFDTMICSAEKKEPDAYWHAAELLGAGVPDCVVYDDMAYARKCAETAGFRTVSAL